ncbi:hypothetical protein SAMN04488032_103293 [Pacificibacter marinus]|uniref:Uncharacterized protein n=1 Tax=Pacificibacter marinus TaxID=658057 RepID=A0A1Y5TNR3_9RHOB|nr:hypothetical protein SAMN04488032_103293 [Pacificibacter marinus]SLN67985.1 hypothetical protein PAM7971_03608 [Pacificibacter marinus]
MIAKIEHYLQMGKVYRFEKNRRNLANFCEQLPTTALRTPRAKQCVREGPERHPPEPLAAAISYTLHVWCMEGPDRRTGLKTPVRVRPVSRTPNARRTCPDMSALCPCPSAMSFVQLLD